MSKFFGDTHTILELDLSKRDVLHLLVPSFSSYVCMFMRYIWGCLLTDRLESKQKQLAKQIETILRITNPQRHIHTNINIKSKHKRPQTKACCEGRSGERSSTSNQWSPAASSREDPWDGAWRWRALVANDGALPPMRSETAWAPARPMRARCWKKKALMTARCHPCEVRPLERQ